MVLGVILLFVGMLGVTGYILWRMNQEKEVTPGESAASSNNCCDDGSWIAAHGGVPCSDTTSPTWTEGYNACQAGQCSCTPDCSGDGGSCSDSGDCCSGLTCTSGKCGGSCKVAGDSCSAGSECCSGTCSGGVCTAAAGVCDGTSMCSDDPDEGSCAVDAGSGCMRRTISADVRRDVLSLRRRRIRCVRRVQ